MAHIKIISIEDSHDCENCGGDWELGYEVTIDGEPFGDYAPLAYCRDSVGHRLDVVLRDLLIKFGNTVEVV